MVNRKGLLLMAKWTPCDEVDMFGKHNCPYEDTYSGYESEMCRNCCGHGVDEDDCRLTNEYEIRYTETYARTYYVTADSFEEAKDKLFEMINDGKEKGPDECINSNFELVDVDCY